MSRWSPRASSGGRPDDVPFPRVSRRNPHRTLRVTVEAQPGDQQDRRGVLTVLSGAHPGTLVPIDEAVVLGRTDEADVVLDDESLSRRHARFMRMHGQYYLQDLDSTNGTFVDGHRISTPVTLEDGSRIQLGKSTLLRFALQDDREFRASLEMYEATVRDGLTGLFNRHYFDQQLANEVSFAIRHERPLAVVFVDADHFKRINDTRGHAAGDEVLRALARLLTETVRAEDVVARVGGEEFVVLVRDIPTAGMLAIGERLRAGVEALEVTFEGERIPVTVSVGVATLEGAGDAPSPEGLLARADAALYRAKEAGRNRVQLA